MGQNVALQSGRRSQLEMKMDVMEALTIENRLTNLMYRTKTAYPVIRHLIAELMRLGLAEASAHNGKDGRTKRVYALTDNGQKVVVKWKELKDWVS